jgi:c-di-GMP-binding flagellar brake protein YcgR
LRTQSGRIAEDIAMLSGAVVHTIRTASTDADRRTEERVETKEPCSILPGGGGAPVRATIRNLSNGGAAIVPDNGSRLAEAHGTVVFDRRGGARVRFDVRAVDASGVLHVQFDRASITAEAERAIRSVLEAAAGRQEAPVQQRRA